MRFFKTALGFRKPDQCRDACGSFQFLDMCLLKNMYRLDQHLFKAAELWASRLCPLVLCAARFCLVDRVTTEPKRVEHLLGVSCSRSKVCVCDVRVLLGNKGRISWVKRS